jgi:hypothetical protein
LEDAVILLDDYAALQKENKAPLLIPPTWRKVFAGQLAGVWDAAVAALKTATRIVILGYSMPETDMHFKYLLAAGLQENISLRKIFFVNPGLAQAAESERLTARLFKILHKQHFERGVVELVPASTSEFFAGPTAVGAERYMIRIGRPLPTSYPSNAAYMTFGRY